jgi:hypothetical protein
VSARATATALRLAAAFTPAAAAGWLVWRHAVNVPVWDDWLRAPLAEAWHAGTLGAGDLYAPHIDHRIVLPRLLMLANLVLTGGDLRFEMGVTFALVLAGAAALAALLYRTLPSRAVAATFVANLFLFSPLQWENFLWAVQTAFVIPLACLSLALLALASPLSPRARFAACAAAAVVATHSFGHGLLLWPAVAAYVALESGGRTKRAFLVAWFAAAALVLVPYFTVGDLRNTSFHAYGRIPGDPAPALDSAGDALEQPAIALDFWLSMLGGALARAPWWRAAAAAPWVGGGLLALLAGAALAARRPETWRRALPWLVLGATAAVACAVTALGRSALRVDPEYALVPRYAAVSTCAVVALVALGALLLPRRAAAAGALALAACAAWSWQVGREGMGVWREARLHARTALVYIEHFAPQHPHRLDWTGETAREWARMLDRRGHLSPPLAREPTLAPFARDPAPVVPGARISRAEVGDGALHLRGRADAHGVLVTVAADEGAPTVVGLGELRTRTPRRAERQDHIFNAPERPGAPHDRWRLQIPLAALPLERPLRLELWTVDAARMRAARAADHVALRDTPEGQAASLGR